MDRLRILADRRDWLERRIADRDGSEGSLGYAASELEALDWLIPVVEDMVVNEREDARNVHRQRLDAGWRTTCKWASRYVYRADPDEWERLVAKAHPDVAEQLRADLGRVLANEQTGDAGTR